MIQASPDVDSVMKAAVDTARSYKHIYITTEHLFYALLNDEKIGKAIKMCKYDLNEALTQCAYILATKFTDIVGAGEPTARTHGLDRVMQRAFTQGMFQGQQQLQTIDMFLSLESERNGWTVSILNALKWDMAKIVSAFNGTTSDSEADKLLSEFCVNISQRAADGKIDPVIGRDYETMEVAEVLARKTKNNVMLLGDPGVGKTAVIEGLALKIHKGEVPEFLLGHTIWGLDITSMMAGTKFRGEFEERIKQVLTVLKERPNTILFIDEGHMIMGAGAGNKDNMDLGNMLKPVLSRGEIKCILAMTWEDYRKSIEKDRAMQRRFYRVTVDEPTPKVCKEILMGLKTSFEQFHKIKYNKEAIEAAVDLTVRFITNRKLPDKAIDVIDMVGAANKVRPVAERLKKVNRDMIAAMVSKMAGIPLTAINSEQRPDENQDLDIKLKSKVFEQDQAIDTVLNTVYVSRAGLRTGTGPQGSFLFLGPTGVGKTEMVKGLASVLGMDLIRFDMSEFMEKHAVSRLIGAPPGYVGFEDSTVGGGLLINEIEKKPHSIILLDEIEKAHPDVFNILLQAMDYGKITGSSGKPADLTNCILVMTSNLGARDMEKNTVGFNTVDQTRTDDDDETKRAFAPEFRNRLDAIVKFNKLSVAGIRMVANKFVTEVKTLLKPKKVNLKIDTSAWDYLVKNGYDPQMGARPMKRLVEREISLPISKEILFGKLAKGGTVTIKVVDNKMVFMYNVTSNIIDQKETVDAER